MGKDQSTSKKPDLLINVLIGAGDGLIVPSALIAGLTAAGTSHENITRIVLVVSALAAVVMGIGGYYTRKNASLQPRNYVKDEMKMVEREKTRAFFANLDMTEEMQEKAISEMDKDDLEWKNFMERYDLDPSTQGPARSALVIGLSYAIAGLLVLAPFFAEMNVKRACIISMAVALPLLFLLGWLKGSLTKASGWIGGLKLLITGAVTIAAAYTVVSLFSSH